MNLSQFATRHNKAILFMTVALCLVGAFEFASMPVPILPDVTFPRIVVIADAGERPVRSVLASITRPLEESIATVPGVNRIRSQTERGAAQVNIDFAWGTDIVQALQFVTAKVDEVRPT